MPMPYWQAPDRLFDEPDEFVAWARAAFTVAERTKKPKKKARARGARTAATAKSAAKRKTAPKRR